jgi:acyl-homoserine-lactone acylase
MNSALRGVALICVTVLAVLMTPQSVSAPFAPRAATAASSPKAEILWDRWGVPHIFAQDAESLFHAFGWAQMHSHGDVILRLYAQARGRGAEYFGKDYLVLDQGTRLFGIPQRARRWYAVQTPEFKKYLDAFARGMNEYANQHPDRLAAAGRAVLPISGVDVMGHIARTMAIFVAAPSECGSLVPGFGFDVQPGSNAWAIGPTHSASGRAMLLTNPHLPWWGMSLFYEAHLVAPGVNGYGAALVGYPTLGVAFNDVLGWTHTFNTLDGCDVYALSFAGKKVDDGYRFDGRVRAFERRTETIKVRQVNGSLTSEPFVVRRSIHGPVVIRDKRALAVRMVGQDLSPVAGVLDQWWSMLRAGDLATFQAAVRRQQLPIFNVIYADRDGHVMLVYNGLVPVRPKGDVVFWSQPVPGETSALLWTKAHRYDELPKTIDPASGWVQNSNSPPWYMTSPALNPADYPAYLSPRFMFNREQRGIRMLTSRRKISFAQMVQDKHSTRSELADQILPDLIAAARRYGKAPAQQAADVLETWDRLASPDSRGAVLFTLWYEAWTQQTFAKARSVDPRFSPTDGTLGSRLLFREPWTDSNVLGTPRGLADPQLAADALERAAGQLQRGGGPLDAAWGEIARLRRGKVDVPANGGDGRLGIFRPLFFAPDQGGRFRAVAGETYVAAVEFSNPIRAMVLMTYGNSSQPGSIHVGDQLRLAARNQLRPAWRTRAEIEANLEFRTTLVPVR